MTPRQRIAMLGQMVNHAILGDLPSALGELPNDWGAAVLGALASDLDDLAGAVRQLALERA